MEGPREKILKPVAGRGPDFIGIGSIGCLVLLAGVVVTLIGADAFYLLVVRGQTWNDIRNILNKPEVLDAMILSVETSFTTLFLVILTSVPIGYGLSRYRFFGHSILNTIIDAPVVLPPVVVGLSLLAFFGSAPGRAIKDGMALMNLSLMSGIGIVMCQYLISLPYCVRAVKVTFDAVDGRLENVALTLGCSPRQVFFRVSLPLARSGLIAGGVMAWARAIGVFGPLMVFVGTSPRVQVMPTTMWLELNVGNIEASLALALVSTAMALMALLVVHRLAPGRQWA